ncbi:hypothetical protein DP939_44645 [Spongiactinospora rosea]|uniref:Uncharacterized protein n=1 Tax=Spongiactinospora rosea TaxID=2248750 RepID=A0A366LCR4_9ACTN|nr:hypothetical protein DP939_44645 [Spongiactinospora rosea]
MAEALFREQVAAASESEAVIRYPHGWAAGAGGENGGLVYSGMFLADDAGGGCGSCMATPS